MKKIIKIIFLFIIISLSFLLIISISGCKNLSELIQSLSSNNEEIRSIAIDALTKTGKPAVEPLIELLNDKNKPIVAKNSAAIILGKIGDSRAIKPLVSCLTEINTEYNKSEVDIQSDHTDESAENPYLIQSKPPEPLDMQKAMELLEEMSKNDTGVSQDTTENTDKDISKVNQYMVFTEAVYALSLLCKDSENEKIIADEINKIDKSFVSVSYPYLIEIGASGTEDMLIEVLNIYGSSIMAEAFINSGNEKLEEAARE